MTNLAAVDPRGHANAGSAVGHMGPVNLAMSKWTSIENGHP
ncbi:hypothetical protein C7476_101353 [Phyllobacterium bourgognense]|uniref:Uncharacterized protein n=1 Tax=Phyllobacterium bourgognense TaxID=314236 RepID=A0A368Z8V9_9HYPH|nr:hypothetical protein C7476_101353 [Phyllobacterium bourgognense]